MRPRRTRVVLPAMLGGNMWGNLRLHVALRHDPYTTGYVISDLGPVQVVAQAEDGTALVGLIGSFVAVGSKAHRSALARR